MTAGLPPRVEQSCRSCRFWRREPVEARGPDWGECRRLPPALPPIEQEKLLHVGIWPHTAAEDWCGEWQETSEPEASDGNPDPAEDGRR